MKVEISFNIHLVEDVPLPVVGWRLYLEHGVALLRRPVVPHGAVHAREPALADQLAHAEGVLAVARDGAGLEHGERRGREVHVAGVGGGVRPQVLRQLVVRRGDVRLHRRSVVGEPPREVSDVVTW